jgi:hypothetical protein
MGGKPTTSITGARATNANGNKGTRDQVKRHQLRKR